MADSKEKMFELGKFDPIDAKRLLMKLTARGIPFEVGGDYSGLARPNRGAAFYNGTYPSGSQLVVQVPDSRLSEAQAIFRDIYPL